MFWDNYVRLCAEQKESPNKVAKNLSIASGTVTGWKNGRTPQAAILKKVADYFSVNVDYFYGNNHNTKGVKIPVYGSVPAGIPLEAIENIIDYEEITPELAATGEYMALKIKGESMKPRIEDGDVVIIKVQSDVDSGDTAVVFVNGDDATCKKIKKTPEGVWLMPNNPAFEPKFYDNQQIIDLPIRILGKVVELRRTF